MRIVVGPADAGQRVDAVVARALSRSARQARAALLDGKARLDGRVVRKGIRVAPGQVIEIDDRDLRVEPVLVARALPLEVLYQDESLIAINKPAGLPSHPLRAGEGDTAAAGIVARFPECAESATDAREGGLVHRLDRETSGVLVAARSRAAWLGLRQALSGLGCEKIYLAEVVGAPASHDAIEAAIGRGGPRGGVARVGTGRDRQPARTEIERVALHAPTALVRARIAAGRPHQVRAHLAYLGFPVLGDERYGDAQSIAIARAADVVGFRLHAARVTFDHPTTRERISIEAPPPAWAV